MMPDVSCAQWLAAESASQGMLNAEGVHVTGERHECPWPGLCKKKDYTREGNMQVHMLTHELELPRNSE
ncbi:hypothetical protein PM082_003985 [Marasmius tenuissimus]|nr:hypothetical protein PM082_003985 [Marasmius tenuissimus]